MTTRIAISYWKNYKDVADGRFRYRHRNNILRFKRKKTAPKLVPAIAFRPSRNCKIVKLSTKFTFEELRKHLQHVLNSDHLEGYIDPASCERSSYE